MENNNEDKNVKNNGSRRMSIISIIAIIILLVVLGVVIYMNIVNNDDGCNEKVIHDNTNNNINNPFDDPFSPNSNFRLDKPIIYLYPEQDMTVDVKLVDKENITCSYPKYVEGWKVLAKTNGDLKDLTTGRNLYALYYEGINKVDFKVENEGFVVKGEDSAKFLEEKLEILGLNERETEEFIVYWLPKLEANKYNYIRFATSEEINENMKLEINPTPDTLIRILMIFKGLDNEINVNEQNLKKQYRMGFTAVEWGGTELK